MQAESLCDTVTQSRGASFFKARYSLLGYTNPPPLLKRLGSVTMWMIHSKYPDSPEKLDDGLLAVPHVGTEDLCPAHREERGTYIGNRANIH